MEIKLTTSTNQGTHLTKKKKTTTYKCTVKLLRAGLALCMVNKWQPFLDECQPFWCDVAVCRLYTEYVWTIDFRRNYFNRILCILKQLYSISTLFFFVGNMEWSSKYVWRRFLPEEATVVKNTKNLLSIRSILVDSATTITERTNLWRRLNSALILTFLGVWSYMSVLFVFAIQVNTI